jgi:hypothetical protein
MDVGNSWEINGFFFFLQKICFYTRQKFSKRFVFIVDIKMTFVFLWTKKGEVEKIIIYIFLQGW